MYFEECEDDSNSRDLTQVGANQVEEVESDDGIRTFQMKSERDPHLNVLEKLGCVWGDSERVNKQLKEKGFKKSK